MNTGLKKYVTISLSTLQDNPLRAQQSKKEWKKIDLVCFEFCKLLLKTKWCKVYFNRCRNGCQRKSSTCLCMQRSAWTSRYHSCDDDSWDSLLHPALPPLLLPLRWSWLHGLRGEATKSSTAHRSDRKRDRACVKQEVRLNPGKSYLYNSIVSEEKGNKGFMHFRVKFLSGVLTRTLGLWRRAGLLLRRGWRRALWTLGPVFGSPVLLPLSVVLHLRSLNPTKQVRDARYFIHAQTILKWHFMDI